MVNALKTKRGTNKPHKNKGTQVTLGGNGYVCYLELGSDFLSMTCVKTLDTLNVPKEVLKREEIFLL